MERYAHRAEELAAPPTVEYRVEIRDVDAERFEEERAYAEAVDGTVAAAVRNDAGELLFIHSEAYGGWVVPGGGVDPGEDLRAAAAREVREETGVEASIGRPLLVLNSVARHEGETLSGYFVLFEGEAEDPETARNPGLGDEGITDAAWFGSMPADTAAGGNVDRVLRRVGERFEGFERPAP